jgi:hypothetical protein
MPFKKWQKRSSKLPELQFELVALLSLSPFCANLGGDVLLFAPILEATYLDL